MIEIMKEHYGEQTPYILVDNVTPMMNSLPFQRGFLGNKKLKKILKNHELNDSVQYIMNIAFTTPQQLEIGEVIEWSMKDLNLEVIVLSHERAFVKGTYVWIVVAGIKE
ncbi:hypothetical protein [Citrobacter sp. Igbk 16]|uniref:hypothetical protein n=1 Tax=Citrobacter sp. Igbk 16 TaxID=2963958 RepID=UPI002303DC1A|nr:hypothetical protein [Citrobacter sp. Igbk 16]MDA8518695.1 hypothetical protein [Citrobacter sp. Igbk 16]